MDTSWLQLLVRVFCLTFTSLGLLCLQIGHIVNCSAEIIPYSEYHGSLHSGDTRPLQFNKRALMNIPIGKPLQDSIADSRALEYVLEIFNNKTLKDEQCLNSKFLSLKQFNLQYSKSTFDSLYEEVTSQAVTIANSLTNLFFNHDDVSINTLNDKETPPLTSLLRYTIEKIPAIISSGILFENGFFPYVNKTPQGTSVSNMVPVFGYVFADFSLVHQKTNYSYLWQRSAEQFVSGQGSNVSYVGKQEGYWTEPYYDCAILDKWVLTYSVPFFQMDNGKPKLGGVVLINIDLNTTDVNQCARDQGLFSFSDKCQPETTRCENLPGVGISLGNYICECLPGYYFPDVNTSQTFFNGADIERSFLENENTSASIYQCLPCQKGCSECEDDSPCTATYNIYIRGIPLGIQSFCVTVTVIVGIIIVRLRKCKVMVSGIWIMLEIVLIGAVFLYSTVIIQYFEPTTTFCILVPWFRELGFAIVYGALLLKVYRLLAEFQSRKAHRVHVRDKDLLKYLCSIVVVVLGYMSAWTTVTLDHFVDDSSVLEEGKTPNGGLSYVVCKAGWWDYVIEIAELMFLCFGMYICYRVRAAPSDYSEGTYISAAICYEAVVSTIFYTLRHVYWLELHPDYMYLMYFVRCQMTVTVTLLLIFGPKLLYAHRPPDGSSIRSRAYSSSDVPDNMAPETMKLNVGISSNGDVDVGEISLADMDPEDIRAELKRLYTQLQVYKTRKMRKDNPHISKRRGGRKQTHRRFSLQPFHSKHRHHHERNDEHEHEMSKTPEESTNSAEAVPMVVESTVGGKNEDPHENEVKSKESCTVTFKGLKC